MSHQGRNGRDGGQPHRARRTVGMALLIAASLGSAPLFGQQELRAPTPPAVVQPQPSPPTTVPVRPAPLTELAPEAPIVGGHIAPVLASPPSGMPGAAVVDPSVPPAAAAVGAPVLEPDVQVVRFQGPPGLNIEVLAPAPVPVPIGDGAGIITVGLRRGVGYRLRVTGIVERPMAELYPVVEIVGHLHRPEGIDPGKYPIRIAFTQDDMDDAVDRGRLVTKVIYLEDPDQAIPLKLHKDEVSVLTLNPTEPPLRVASALGRPVAIVRLGGRRPTGEEIQGAVAGDIGLDWVESIGSRPCPFLCHSGARCTLPCGPVCVPSPPPSRPSLPRDEYLCDGGDRGIAAGPAKSGRINGIEPRDAVVRFDIGVRGVSQARVLPTNVVCVYAPRFAEVRVSTGTNLNVDIQTTKTDKTVAKLVQTDSSAESRRLVQNQAAELARARARATAYRGKLVADEDSNARAPSAYTGATLASTNLQKQTAELARTRYKAGQVQERIRLDGIKTAEGPMIKGIVEGSSEAIRVWGPYSMVGVETPPDRPGLAVVKRVSAIEAEPGDTLTYAIVYRNMGNTPIKAVSIVDSLLPRLEYVAGTSSGPEGTTFTTAVNRVGATELHWELPGVLAPGATGYVSFQAVVR
jgi:uncharacterized repeat protein (TIGR01451 family)